MAITVSGTLNASPNNNFTGGAWSVDDNAHGAKLFFDGPLPDSGGYSTGGAIEVEYKLVLDPTTILGKVCGAHLVRVVGYRK